MNPNELCFRMLIIIQPTQFSYKHTMRLHILQALAYCDHPQVQRDFTITRLTTGCTSLHWPHGSASYRYVVYVMLLCYKMHWILSWFICDYRWDLEWWLDLLTTYTQDSKLQAITAPPLISTIHKSQHLLTLFTDCCVFISHSLAMADNSGDSSVSRTQVLSSQPPMQNTTLNWQLPG
jgi:hypothetical protein